MFDRDFTAILNFLYNILIIIIKLPSTGVWIKVKILIYNDISVRQETHGTKGIIPLSFFSFYYV